MRFFFREIENLKSFFFFTKGTIIFLCILLVSITKYFIPDNSSLSDLSWFCNLSLRSAKVSRSSTGSLISSSSFLRSLELSPEKKSTKKLSYFFFVKLNLKKNCMDFLVKLIFLKKINILNFFREIEFKKKKISHHWFHCHLLHHHSPQHGDDVELWWPRLELE